MKKYTVASTSSTDNDYVNIKFDNVSSTCTWKGKHLSDTEIRTVFADFRKLLHGIYICLLIIIILIGGSILKRII